MTEAPRSLKLPDGMIHSHLSKVVAPSIEREMRGVRPSPMVIGSLGAKGSAAR